MVLEISSQFWYISHQCQHSIGNLGRNRLKVSIRYHIRWLYSVALFSAMLHLYYAVLKEKGAFLLITINCIGFAIESVYLFVFIIYASKEAKIRSGKWLLWFNVGAYGLIVFVTYFPIEGAQRLTVVGWICAFFSVIVFAAPLSIMRIVIKECRVHAILAIVLLNTLCSTLVLLRASDQRLLHSDTKCAWLWFRKCPDDGVHII